MNTAKNSFQIIHFDSLYGYHFSMASQRIEHTALVKVKFDYNYNIGFEITWFWGKIVMEKY